MKISFISFTEKGAETCCRIIHTGIGKKNQCQGFKKGSFPGGEGLVFVQESLSQWSEQCFSDQDAIVFIGAVGIAVRAVAPFLKSKVSDPAVVAVDDQGKFVIPLLSGHIGGANQLAVEIAREIGAVPVITTATDIHGRFAVDQWARENGLHISDMKLAKQISADLLQGKTLGFVTSFSILGNLPHGLTYGESHLNIELSAAEQPLRENTLRLTPKAVILGVGCRRGTGWKKIEGLVNEVLAKENISRDAIAGVASIDLKKDEEGLMEFCEKWALPFETYSAEELNTIKGDFTESAFVRSVTGVDNVCERAAMLASGDGTLIMRKQSEDGVTLAVAVKALTYSF